MKDEIEKAIIEVLRGMGVETPDFVVEHPADLSHGDYATNVAMVCAKKLEKSPREIAENFMKALEGKIPYVASISIAGPGFINFHLDRTFFAERVAEINANSEAWGKNSLLSGEEIIFEYTSPNLFKPLHVGNLVGNIVGESVSRLFEFGGAEVHRVNYPSDIGLTVAKGVWGLQKTDGDPKDINQIGEAYRAGNDAYENDEDAKKEIESVNRSLYAGDNDALNAIRAQGILTSRTHLTVLCRMLGTTFDTEIFESEVGSLGQDIVRAHIGDVFEESNGAVIYRGEKHGLHTRVFINSQGLPTYEAKDLGNFLVKQKAYPAWKQYFVVTGNEQSEYFKVLIEALHDLFPDTYTKVLEHIATGFLTLTTGKMSSRKGNVLTGEAIIEEVRAEAKKRAEESRADNMEELTEMVAVGALKYQILRQSVGSNIVFDKERALDLEGDSGPYLMYTHARIVSTEKKAEEGGIHSDIKKAPVEPYEVEKILYQFSEIIEKAQRERAPHHVVVFLTQLASAFNTFYAHEKIADPNDEYAPYKLALSKAVRTTLKNGLWVLGIKAPERM